MLLDGPRVLSLLGWASLAGLALGSLAALRRRPASPSAWSGLLVAASLAPMLQVLPAGALFAPRFLYLPLLLCAPLVHAGFRKVTAGWERPAPLVAGLAVLAVAGAWDRARVYASRGSFQLEVLRHEPDDAGAWNSLGLHWEEQGRLELAREAFGQSIRCDPRYSRPWSNLGRLALAEGALDAAEAAFRHAVELGPRNPTAHVNLGSALLRLGRPGEAEPLYRRATELSPGMLAAWRGLARARLDGGRLPEAREALERALGLDPADPLTRRLAIDLEAAEARG
jgi:tetratricopeptide (TPR) repeat protein